MATPPKSNEELEHRIIHEQTQPWSNKDGYPRNAGNIARKVGTSTEEYVRTRTKLEKEGRI